MSFTPYVPRMFPESEDLFGMFHRAKNGFVYRILTEKHLIPEVADDDHLRSPRAKYILTAYLMHLLDRYINRKEENLTVASFLDVYTFYLSFLDGQETLGGPWRSDDARFRGIQYCGPDLPLYDPREIKVDEAFNQGSNVILIANLHGEPVTCVVPDITGQHSGELVREIDIFVKNDYSVLSIPRLRGALAFPSGRDQNPYVVGYILQNSTHQLSDGLIWGPTLDDIYGKLERSYEELCKLNLTWGGNGPEHICLDQNMEPFFDGLFFDWDRQSRLQEGDDRQGWEKVVSFLKQPKLRRSLRIQEKSKQSKEVADAEDRIPVARSERKRVDFPDLPGEILEMILKPAGLFPGELTWTYDHFMIQKGGGNPGNDDVLDDSSEREWRRSEREWRRWTDGGFAKVHPVARSLFYGRNHFVVPVNRLESFLVELRRRPIMKYKSTEILNPKDKIEIYPYLKSINVRVSAEREGECGIGWRNSIEKLSQQCPQLKEVQVSIYGKNESWDEWWENHEVLLKLRRECRTEDGSYLTKVSLADYQYMTRHGEKETEALILEWLRS